MIVSADHGESFVHGYFTHQGPYLYEEVTHIPLIIKIPDQNEGRIINDIVEQIDISATILDIADIPLPEWMEGRSITPLLYNEKLPAEPAFSMNLQNNPSQGHQITRGTFAVWEGKYKLIHYLSKDKNLLFNLRKDPYEQHNVFDSEPERGQHLLSLIQRYIEKANEKIRSGEQESLTGQLKE